MDLEIISNYHERPIICGSELTEKEREWWLDLLEPDDLDYCSFFRYKHQVYFLGDFMRFEHYPDNSFDGWDGYSGDSFFSGTVVKYSDDCEGVIVGWYMS